MQFTIVFSMKRTYRSKPWRYSRRAGGHRRAAARRDRLFTSWTTVSAVNVLFHSTPFSTLLIPVSWHWTAANFFCDSSSYKLPCSTCAMKNILMLILFPKQHLCQLCISAIPTLSTLPTLSWWNDISFLLVNVSNRGEDLCFYWSKLTKSVSYVSARYRVAVWLMVTLMEEMGKEYL